MRVLLVKLSSLGDVVHSYPAIADAAAAIPGLEIDWLVDEAFAPLACLHPAIGRVIALPIRRMKKRPLATFAELRSRIRELRSVRYDVVIDAQGLVKSAIAGRFARGTRRHGFARGSARESLATFGYDTGHDIPETEHMAERIRKLFAASLGYEMPGRAASSGIDAARFAGAAEGRPYIVLIHGTSWKTKTWTVGGWRELARRCAAAGMDVVLFAHGAEEEARVARIAEGLPHVRRLPPGRLEDVVPILAGAAGVVSVDTGLGHLAAAFDLPTVGLYGPTNPGLTGLVGAKAAELVSRRPCAPCEKSTCAIRPDFGEGPPCLADQGAGDVFALLQDLLPKTAGTV